MGEAKTFTNNLLTLELRENNNSINIRWTGKSVERNPGIFINPILVELANRSNESNKRIVMDFRKIDFMNSSTITPLIKILERANKGKMNITVQYRKSLKWQDLSFSALKIFQTKDKRVEIKGI